VEVELLCSGKKERMNENIMRVLEGEVLRIFVLEVKHVTELNVLLTVNRDISVQ
jgi:hypothetical protein